MTTLALGRPGTIESARRAASSEAAASGGTADVDRLRDALARGKERFDLNLRDRIIILEDADHDGKFDKRTVFTDEIQMLTSIERGFGGVYALCPPNLLFIPMDGDKPAGPAQVILDEAAIHPREVIRRAMDVGASAMILVHNHPSGSPEPSRADIQITQRIAEAGRLLGVTVHDHVIIGREGHTSLRAKGLI